MVQGESSRMLLLTVGPTDSPTYELYVFPAQTRGNDSLDNVDPIRGTGVAAAFVARNKFAVLDRGKQVRPDLQSDLLTLHLKIIPSFRRSLSELSMAGGNLELMVF